MNIYLRKKRWKLLLLFMGVLIVSGSLWYTNTLVKKVANDERNKARIWADAIHRKASLVNYTNEFFDKIREEERKRVQLYANATRRLIEAESDEDLTFYSEIISGNTTIPVILTYKNDNINDSKNIDLGNIKVLSGKLKEEFTKYPRINVFYGNKVRNYLYYKDSKLFTELREVLNDLIQSFFSEVVVNSASVPVIILDSTLENVIAYGNIDSVEMQDKESVEKIIADMESQNRPIRIELANIGVSYIYYRDSFLLTQLRYFPIAQLLIISVFLLIAYFLFNTSRKFEQNQVWLGMSRETAHQLGTPLSSLIAWHEMLKTKDIDKQIIEEIGKDIRRLENVTNRFSKIGSPPKLQDENIVQAIYESVDYIKLRSPRKVNFNINISPEKEIIAPLNLHLFEWVIENLCRNAIDAMEGKGTVDIHIANEQQNVVIDITDSGKGIPKRLFKTIFNPGYTSKQRGWGLGLTLSERIIENYHQGKIFVKSSAQNKGSTFRMVLWK